MALWQWIGLAFVSAVMCMVVRIQQPQMAGLCAAAAGLILVASALESLKDLQGVFARLTELGGLKEGYLGTLLKVLGVSYAAEMAAQLCEDLGEVGLARKVELAGKLSVFSLTAPLLMTLLEMILELAP